MSEGSASQFEPDVDRYLTYPTLTGAAIRNIGPIDAVYLELGQGLRVLYGRNGAGKTQLLNGLAKSTAIDVDDFGRDCELFFQWLPDRCPREHFDEMLETSPGRSWFDLRGNPWTRNRLPSDLMVFDALDNISSSRWDLEELIRAIDAATPVGTPVGHARLARDVVLYGCSPWYIDSEDELELVVHSVVELLSQGRFASVAPSGRSRSKRQLRLHGVIDDGAPTTTASVAALLSGWEPASAHSAEDDWFDHLLDEGVGTLFANAIDAALNDFEQNLPVHVGRPIVDFDGPGDAPLHLLWEGQVDVVASTRCFLESQLPLVPDEPSDDSETRVLVQEGESFRFHAAIDEVLGAVARDATRFFQQFLEDAPTLGLELRSPRQWLDSPAIRWCAFDQTGRLVALEQLSKAQFRWATFAIQLATTRASDGLPMLVLLDEPEAALHRRAERHLARGLAKLSEELGATVVVATHSPAFLRADLADLYHVVRGRTGSTEVHRMPLQLRERIDELGIEVEDLLQFCRVAVLVEGEHELTIFDQLFRDELSQRGIELFALRGAKHLKNASDAQLLFRFTTARLVVCLDNEDSSRVQDIWHRACAAADEGANPLEILEEFGKGGWKSEAKFLSEYCALALRLEARDRITFIAMSEPDVIEYLPIEVIAPRALKFGWHGVRRRFAESGTTNAFKVWMTKTYGAQYDEATIRSAVQSMDSLPPDFLQILNL